MNRSLLLASAVLIAFTLGTPAAQADSPREFLFHAQRGDNSEIMLGRLAAERGRSSSVRDYGQTLVSDHRQARDEVRELGRRFGLRADREPAPEARQERDRLMGMRGREFDREFIRYMVDDHRKDIAAFRDEARENHGAVSELARRQLPILRNHLETAMALDGHGGRFSDGRFDQTRDRGDNRTGDRYNRNDGSGNNYDRSSDREYNR